MGDTFIPLKVAISRYQSDTEHMIIKNQKQSLIQFIEIYGDKLSIQRIDK